MILLWLSNIQQQQPMTLKDLTQVWQKQRPGRIFIRPNSRVIARKSEVGTATRYGLEGPEFELREVRFYAPVLTGPETYLASYIMGTG
jgi:hypothetical protein